MIKYITWLTAQTSQKTKVFAPDNAIGGVVGFGGLAAKTCTVSSICHRFELRHILASALDTCEID